MYCLRVILGYLLCFPRQYRLTIVFSFGIIHLVHHVSTVSRVVHSNPSRIITIIRTLFDIRPMDIQVYHRSDAGPCAKLVNRSSSMNSPHSIPKDGKAIVGVAEPFMCIFIPAVLFMCIFIPMPMFISISEDISGFPSANQVDLISLDIISMKSRQMG